MLGMGWEIAITGATIYCFVRALFDLRKKQYVWAIAGLLAAAAILLYPVQTHPVLVDLPSQSQ